MYFNLIRAGFILDNHFWDLKKVYMNPSPTMNIEKMSKYFNL